jgi:GR25 family glycosyltransferase involved in LPS biosynthesis
MVKYCYYLNLDRRKDRKEHIENELNKSEILKSIYKKFDAVDGLTVHPRSIPTGLITQNALEDVLSDTISAWGLSLTQGGLGVLLSYVKLFEEIATLDDFAITFEDDTVLNENFDDELRKVLNELPKDFDICYLGYADMDVKKIEYSNNLSRPDGMVVCLPALVISPEGAKKILSKLKNIDHQIDTAMYHMMKTLNCFIINHKLVSIKNHFSTDIQGNNNCLKKYEKQNYIIATLAFGDDANNNARKLARDLKHFGQDILIVTNKKGFFSDLSNVKEIEYVGDKFSYNKKYICFEEGFKLKDAVVYIDSDARIYYEKYKNTYTNFFVNVSPGFHSSWNWGKIVRENSRFFNSIDVAGRVDGYGELALELCKEMNIDYESAYHFQEGIIVLSKEDGKEKILLDTWKKLAIKLDQYEEEKDVKKLGVGEGNLIGLSLVNSQITINGTEICDLLGESLKYNFWGIYREKYINNFPNRKLIRSTDSEIINEETINVKFKDKEVDLTYSIMKEDDDVMTLIFNWNRKNVVEFLDHEFRIGETVYHFNSDKSNEMNFPNKKGSIIEHTYDWFGEKEWKEIYRYE